MMVKARQERRPVCVSLCVGAVRFATAITYRNGESRVAA